MGTYATVRLDFKDQTARPRSMNVSLALVKMEVLVLMGQTVFHATALLVFKDPFVRKILMNV